MGSYIPSTREERLSMLESIGMHSFDELYADIPEKLRFKDGLSLPSELSELEVFRKMEEIAEKNTQFTHIFRGAGSYHHYIPAIVRQVTSKEEFITAYTPYQAEISQGLLQSIFEYQTMICELTGMDVSNASVYDGATAAAEAAAMCRDRKRGTICVSASVDPKILSVIRTYCFGSGAPLVVLPEKEGLTDLESWNSMDTSSIACLIIQTPNYYGLVEDGAAIAVGEGQPLGLPMGFGGPYLGFMASTKDMMRKLPGRIVGQTTDVDGKRAYVLTLQAREQHIRREKASSNICSNQALCAMTAAVYLSAMGSAGLEKVASSCMANARYLLEGLTALGFTRKYTGEFFHEFVTICPCDAAVLSEKLAAHGYLSGLVTGQKEMLWCTTEMNTRSEIDGLLAVIKEVLA